MRKEILKNSFDKDINFDNLKEAKEYYIEYNEYEDGEVTNAGDIYDYSNMIIEVVENSKYNILGTYNNFESAEKAMEEFDGENGAYLSF